jgi:hypothetical protein
MVVGVLVGVAGVVVGVAGVVGVVVVVVGVVGVVVVVVVTRDLGGMTLTELQRWRHYIVV